MDPVTLLLLIALFLIPAYIILQSYSKRRKIAQVIDQLPGPPKYPIFGTSYELMKSPREKLWKLQRHRAAVYGPLYRSWYGNFPLVHLLKPEHIEVVLSSHTQITKGPTYNFLKPWLGQGLLLSTGAKWHNHRKLITPTFHFKILESFQEVFNEKANLLINKLSEKANGEVFDVYPIITRCALDIICETAMGVQINAMESTKQAKYFQAIDGYTRLTIVRNHQPLLQNDFIFRFTKSGKEYNKYLQVLHDFTKKVIKERKEMLKVNNKAASELTEEDLMLGKKKRLSFLDLLIEASKEGTLLSDEDLREEVDTFMFGGHDTTATAMCWALFLLGNHPEIQDKVVEELNQVLHEGEPITTKVLGELKYLERVIKESLRLYPSAPIVMRTLSDDLEIDGLKIPAGCGIIISIYDAHRDLRYYKDPEKFNPDRFLPENSKGRHPYAYIPFSAGLRNCVGQKFAMNEEKTLLSSILKKFKVKALETPESIVTAAEIIFKSLNGTFLSLESRS